MKHLVWLDMDLGSLAVVDIRLMPLVRKEIDAANGQVLGHWGIILWHSRYPAQKTHSLFSRSKWAVDFDGVTRALLLSSSPT